MNMKTRPKKEMQEDEIKAREAKNAELLLKSGIKPGDAIFIKYSEFDGKGKFGPHASAGVYKGLWENVQNSTLLINISAGENRFNQPVNILLGCEINQLTKFEIGRDVEIKDHSGLEGIRGKIVSYDADGVYVLSNGRVESWGMRQIGSFQYKD